MKDGSAGQFIRRSEHFAAENGTPVNCPESLSPQHILVQAVSASRNLLHRAQIFRFHSLAEAQPIAAAMEEIDTQLLAPMLWEDELVGLVCIGEKQSGEMYEAEELETLRNMMPQASLALRNAQLYAEVVQVKEYNENILRQMESGVIAVDAQENVVLCNPAAERILGLSRDEVIDHKLELLPENIADCLRPALTGYHPRSGYRFDIQKPDGQRVPVACSTSTWGGSPGSPEGALAVISDLTIVEELEQERQEAERLALIRVLSAGMAHEIRNPMVAIRTFAELLPTHWDDAEFRSDFLITAQDEIHRIEQLLTQLLMLSKPADAVTEEIDVSVLCEGVVRAMSARAQSQQIALSAALVPISYQPIGDEGRLHQAILNLITNAVEAEPQGGQVKVTTEEGPDAEGNPRVVIRVYNSASYIPPSQIEQIFRPFYSQKPGGTGLGLAICQTIIEEHGGTIQVRSAPSDGTEFIVELPIKTEADSVDNGDG